MSQPPKLPKPPGWFPAATAEEALARMRARWSHEQLDFEMVCEHVGERVAIMYEGADEVPDYRVFETPPACRIFRAVPTSVWKTGWLSAYVHNSEDVDRVIEWLEKTARSKEKRAS